MLVLSRKINEKIMIGDDIELIVVAIAGDNVRLGIKAPRDVKILRSEVYEEIEKQNLEAMAVSSMPAAQASERLRQMLTDLNKDQK